MFWGYATMFDEVCYVLIASNSLIAMLILYLIVIFRKPLLVMATMVRCHMLQGNNTCGIIPKVNTEIPQDSVIEDIPGDISDQLPPTDSIDTKNIEGIRARKKLIFQNHTES